MTYRAPLLDVTRRIAGDGPPVSEERRAADLLVWLVAHHSGGVAARNVASLCRSNQEAARRLVLRRMGYVPADPARWVQLHRRRGV